MYLLTSQFCEMKIVSNMDTIAWLFVTIAILGSWLNSTKKLEASYWCWMVSNIGLFVYNLFLIGSFSQATLFAIYLANTLYGLSNYSPKIANAKEKLFEKINQLLNGSEK